METQSIPRRRSFARFFLEMCMLVVGLTACPQSNPAPKPAEGYVSATVPLTGGQVSVPQLGTITVPPDTFSTPAQVGAVPVKGVTGSPPSKLSGVMLNWRSAADTAIQVELPDRPTKEIDITLVPSSVLQAQRGKNSYFAVAVTVDSGLEEIDTGISEQSYVLLNSIYDQQDGSVSAKLSPDLFTQANYNPGFQSAKYKLQAGLVIKDASSDLYALNQYSGIGGVIKSQEEAAQCPAGPKLTRPVDTNYPITSKFGSRNDPKNPGKIQNHRGTDFGVPAGTEVRAVLDGTVEFISKNDNATYGKVVIIRHRDAEGNNIGASLYMHLSDNDIVSVGQEVKAGDKIALSGNSGSRSTRPHLHFEFSMEDEPIGAVVGKGRTVVNPNVNRIDGEKCLDDPPPPPPPPPPGPTVRGPAANTSGDPHLHTFDALSYDFQGAGEFTLVRSQNSALWIQVRQEPASEMVAVNTAVAAKLGNDVVSFYAKETVPVRINGSAQAFTNNTMTLPAGLVKDYGYGRYSVEWATGEVLQVLVGVEILNVDVALSETTSRPIRGLLGNADKNPDNDVTFPDGKKVSPLDAATLYGPFADAWRISQAESMFTYAAGKSTASFTRKNFPTVVTTLTDLTPDQRAQAEATCRAQGVTEALLLQGCILDVGLTGNANFASLAAQTQQHSVVDFNLPGLDRSFSGDGVLATRFNASQGISRAIALQPDGKILVAGDVLPYDLSSVGFMSVARFMPDGTLDTAFAQQGLYVANQGAPEPQNLSNGNDVVVQADGKILLAGALPNANGRLLAAVIRLNANGTPDPTFGQNGRVLADLDYSLSGPFQPDVYGAAQRIKIDPAGRILLLGNVGGSGMLWRYKADGQLDQSFHGRGFVWIGEFNAISDRYFADLTLEPNGGYTVLAHGQLGSLIRFTAADQLDNTFGTGGVFTIPADLYFGAAQQLLRLPDGSYLAAFVNRNVHSAQEYRLAVMKVRSSGSLEAGFGQGGLYNTSFSENYIMSGTIASQSDGKIVLAARILQQPGPGIYTSLTRLMPNGQVDSAYHDGGRLTLATSANGGGGGASGIRSVIQPDNRMLVMLDGESQPDDYRSHFTVFRVLP